MKEKEVNEETIEVNEQEGQEASEFTDDQANPEVGTTDEGAVKEDQTDSEIKDSDSGDNEEQENQNTLSELDQKLKESEERYLRLQADYDNYRKRTQKERSSIIARANKDLMLSVLPVIDNLERALLHADHEDSFTKGVDMVYKQLVEELQKQGLSVIEAVNQPFDPNYHQAVAKEPADVASDTVLEEYQKGYLLNNEILRPSMVKVSE